jgi:hypothetical protein
MLGFTALSAAPLSDIGAPVVADEAVTNIKKYQRRSKGAPAIPSWLTGHSLRRDGVPASDFVDQTVTNVNKLARQSVGAPPLEEFLTGKTLRRGGSPDTVASPSQYRISHGRSILPELVGGGAVRRMGGGRPTDWVEFSQTYTQSFRVADSSFARYELYVGENKSPDLEGPPTATSATLPFSWAPTPPSSGTKALHIVVRLRNKYGLGSFNVYETIRVINSAGVEQLGPVSDPQDVRIYDGATGYIRVIAKYVASLDQNPADTWEVYVKIGSAPVIGVDAPVSLGTAATMLFLGEETTLAVTVGPYTAGTVAYVLVVAKRAVDSERGVAPVVLHTLALALDLDDGQMFGGSVFEQS